MISSAGNIVTEFVGAFPMIAAYLQRIQFAETIDMIVTPLRSNKRLSHGKTCFILFLYLLCRPHVMYKVEDWVRDTTYLRVLFPEIEPGYLSDDRIADTLENIASGRDQQLNRFESLNSTNKIRAAIEGILGKYGVKGLIDYQINKKVKNIKKKIGRGRPGPNSVYEEKELIEYKLIYYKNEQAIGDTRKLCGYFVLATNKPKDELLIAKALTFYKQECMVELVFERLKELLQVIPICLQLIEHIEAIMYLLMTCAQLFALMDRKATMATVKKISTLLPHT